MTVLKFVAKLVPSTVAKNLLLSPTGLPNCRKFIKLFLVSDYLDGVAESIHFGMTTCFFFRVQRDIVAYSEGNVGVSGYHFG